MELLVFSFPPNRFVVSFDSRKSVLTALISSLNHIRQRLHCQSFSGAPLLKVSQADELLSTEQPNMFGLSLHCTYNQRTVLQLCCNRACRDIMHEWDACHLIWQQYVAIIEQNKALKPTVDSADWLQLICNILYIKCSLMGKTFKTSILFSIHSVVIVEVMLGNVLFFVDTKFVVLCFSNFWCTFVINWGVIFPFGFFLVKPSFFCSMFLTLWLNTDWSSQLVQIKSL